MFTLTLTSDFGNKDYRIPKLKGSLLVKNPNINIIDVSHEIAPFNKTETAYILRNCFEYFPIGTLHWVGVENSIFGIQEPILMHWQDHFFISVNKEVLSLIAAGQESVKYYKLQPALTNEDSLNYFARILNLIIKNGYKSVITAVTEVEKSYWLRPAYSGDVIRGQVVYVDGFGNVVSNISQTQFEEHRGNRSFVITAKGIEFKKLEPNYFSVVKDPDAENVHFGEKFAIFNSAGFLELCVYRSDPNTFGGANTLYGLNVGDTVSVKFKS